MPAASTKQVARCAAPATGRLLVLGLGNALLGDDAVGLHVAREVRTRLGDAPGCSVCESEEAGLALLELIEGYDALMVVDAIVTGGAPAGVAHEMDLSELGKPCCRSPHLLGLADVLALGLALAMPMPRRVCIVAIEVAPPFTIGGAMTTEVRRGAAVAVEKILAWTRGT
jgi:hydrogenase maturation protease